MELLNVISKVVWIITGLTVSGSIVTVMIMYYKMFGKMIKEYYKMEA